LDEYNKKIVTRFFWLVIALPTFRKQPCHFQLTIMPAKATEEYRVALMSLLSQLSELERLGNEFFRKM
jgi:hypothetical protein